MSLRVVIPRAVPLRSSTRIMWRMWKVWGYSSRPCPGGASSRGWLMIEFWIEVPTVQADVLASYEWELDDALLSKKVKARFSGTGSRIEG
jgi:hypothetical protein